MTHPNTTLIFTGNIKCQWNISYNRYQISVLWKENSKNQAEDLSIGYRTNLSNALEEAVKGLSATHVRNIQIREEDRTLAIQIKYIEVKFIKPGTTLVTQ